MKKLLLNLALFFVFQYPLFATHNRAGEITYRHISGYTFTFKITTYTYVYSLANRSELPIIWGDGSQSVAYLTARDTIDGTDYLHNTYEITHTYPGAGIYEVLMEDPNRNDGVKNIPNSVNTIFSIKTTMLVGSDLGANSTPILLNPPIDNAARGHIFIHNPGAYDPDGDSLSYAISICSGEAGEPIEGYILPASTDTLMIDEVSGDLKWITPTEIGVYNIAILVEEWRKGIRIGRIARDMQIDVFETTNNQPVNSPVKDICVKAGNTIQFSVGATDADDDPIRLEMQGGAFQVQNKALFTIDSVGYGYAAGHFLWATNCLNARQQPYYMILKSEDINADINLVDISSFAIKVLPREPENLNLSPGIDTIRVEWDASNCGKVAGYKIYRRIDRFGFIADSCENGVPEYTGYKLLSTVKGANTTHYKDDDLGKGLVPGYDYCYMVTSFGSDGAESFASVEICTTLVAGTPPLLEVSVLKDDVTSGEIKLVWAVPLGIDTIDDGPYRYDILRKSPEEDVFTNIKSILSPDLKDTSFIDTEINTYLFPYTYSVVLNYEQGSIWYALPGYETATSQYIEITAVDNQLELDMKKRSPWLNRNYSVFRENSSTSVFDSIGWVSESEFTDSNLINGQKYTYRSIGYGLRPLYGINYDVVNRSHLASGTPVDTIPPCVPELFVTSECDSSVAFNQLSWQWPDSCAGSELLGYRIYYKNTYEGTFEFVASVTPDIHSFTHHPDSSIEGCYAITAIDSVGNESVKIPYCVYNLCGLYSLPNVFTPNGDSSNDMYTSFNLNGYIQRVNMTIYNRYGKVIFITNNANINWDGRSKDNNKLVSSGVYYYICDVFEPRINGTVIVTLTGFIHVFSGKDNVVAE